jgi:hypothetical protein
VVQEVGGNINDVQQLARAEAAFSLLLGGGFGRRVRADSNAPILESYVKLAIHMRS